MLGIRWILAALAFALPLDVSAESLRLLLLPGDEGEGAETAALVRRHLEAEAARLPGIELVEPPERTCDAVERGCLMGLAAAAGADEVVHATLRPVGGTAALLLVRASTRREGLQRLSDPLPADAAMAPVIRERLVRLLTPERWVGSLVVDALPGSEIWLDGESRGMAPLDAPLRGIVPGQHLLRVVRPGAGEARTYVEIRFEQLTRVRIEPRSDQMAVLSFDAESQEQASALSTAKGPWQTIRWALLGAGALTVVAAAWPALDAAAIGDEREALRNGRGAFPAEARAKQRELRERHDDRRTLSAALVGTGAALLLGGGALFVFEPGGGETEGVQVRAGPGGLGITGSF